MVGMHFSRRMLVFRHQWPLWSRFVRTSWPSCQIADDNQKSPNRHKGDSDRAHAFLLSIAVTSFWESGNHKAEKDEDARY